MEGLALEEKENGKEGGLESKAGEPLYNVMNIRSYILMKHISCKPDDLFRLFVGYKNITTFCSR